MAVLDDGWLHRRALSSRTPLYTTGDIVDDIYRIIDVVHAYLEVAYHTYSSRWQQFMVSIHCMMYVMDGASRFL